MNIKNWINEHAEDFENKTVVITGATGGIGTQLCHFLAETNSTLLLACRNEYKTKKLIAKLKTKYPSVNANYINLDLEDINSIDNFVKILKHTKFDYFIHNSGIYNVPRYKNSVGIDNIFQVNFVAPYYITKELLPTLRENKTKVVAVGSIAHNNSKIDDNDIEFLTRKKSSDVYGNSKLFLMFSLYELFKNETKTSLAIVHPGVTLTNITNHYHKSINWLVKFGMKLFFPNIRKATFHLLYAMINNCGYHEWIGPTIFGVYGNSKIKKLNTCNELDIKKINNIAEIYYKKLKNINF